MISSAQPVPSSDLMPDIHQLDARHQIIWLLTASKAKCEADWLTAAQISEQLADRYGIAISRQRVVVILDHERSLGTVTVVRRHGHTYFKVMRRGEDEIFRNSAKPIYVDPSRAFTSIRALEDVLRSLSGDICVCDTYVDSRILDYFAELKNATRIKLLTENVQDSSRLRRDVTAFENEHRIPIEIRVCSAGQLHDRYLLHPDGLLWIGASLKDMGKKQSMIIALPKSFAKEVRSGFDRKWSNASKFN
jgi:hypothetical protein